MTFRQEYQVVIGFRRTHVYNANKTTELLSHYFVPRYIACPKDLQVWPWPKRAQLSFQEKNVPKILGPDSLSYHSFPLSGTIAHSNKFIAIFYIFLSSFDLIVE